MDLYRSSIHNFYHKVPLTPQDTNHRQCNHMRGRNILARYKFLFESTHYSPLDIYKLSHDYHRVKNSRSCKHCNPRKNHLLKFLVIYLTVAFYPHYFHLFLNKGRKS